MRMFCCLGGQQERWESRTRTDACAHFTRFFATTNERLHNPFVWAQADIATQTKKRMNSRRAATVVLLEELLGRGGHLEGDQLEALLLEALNDLADEAALDAIGLDLWMKEGANLNISENAVVGNSCGNQEEREIHSGEGQNQREKIEGAN